MASENNKMPKTSGHNLSKESLAILWHQANILCSGHGKSELNGIFDDLITVEVNKPIIGIEALSELPAKKRLEKFGFML